MVKHNNVIPNRHFHKKYCQSSRGPLKVRLALNQAGKKKSRRLARAAKAAAIAPRPLEKLRPVVHCPTQKYNAKVRLGKGFTKAELKEAGLTPAFARTIGIAVDHRRTNRSVEGMAVNVDRLKAYKEKLILFPKKRAATPKGLESSADVCATATQLRGAVLPIQKPPREVVMGDITADMKSTSAFTAIRVARKETKVQGYRVAVQNRKKKD